MTDKSKRVGGRPRKYATDVQRKVVAFRVNSILHADMLTGAQKAELSLSEFAEQAMQYYLERGPGQAETTEAMMRRVLVEDREAQRAGDRANLLKHALQISGGYAMANPVEAQRAWTSD